LISSFSWRLLEKKPAEAGNCGTLKNLDYKLSIRFAQIFVALRGFLEFPKRALEFSYFANYLFQHVLFPQHGLCGCFCLLRRGSDKPSSDV
jgi:hypothetical protein